MELLFEKISGNENETKIIAAEFKDLLNPGDIVELNGNLGTGKTFFIKSLCEILGIDFVNSPTFSIVNEYGNNPKIFHFDFYRIENEIELYDIGFEDYINDRESIIFIEWANLFPAVLPRKRFEVNLSFIDHTTRKITAYKHG